MSKEEEDGFVIVMKGILLMLFISFSVCKDKLPAHGAVDSQRASHGRGLTGREEAEHEFPLDFEQEAILSKH